MAFMTPSLSYSIGRLTSPFKEVYQWAKDKVATISSAILSVPQQALASTKLALAAHQAGLIIGSNFPKITLAASATRCFLNLISYLDDEMSLKKIATTTGITFVASGSILYLISGTSTDWLITGAGMLVGAREGIIWAVGADSNKLKRINELRDRLLESPPLRSKLEIVEGFVGRQIGMIVGSVVPKSMLAASAGSYVNRIVSPSNGASFQSMANTAKLTFVVCGSLLYAIPSSYAAETWAGVPLTAAVYLTEQLITTAGTIYGGKEGLSIVGQDPHLVPDFVARSSRSVLCDRSISLITDRIPLVGTPVRMIANEIVYFRQVNATCSAVRNGIATANQVMPDFRLSVAGRQIEPLLVSVLMSVTGRQLGTYFQQMTLSAYGAHTVQAFIHAEFHNPTAEKFAAGLTFFTCEVMLHLISGSHPIVDGVITTAGVVYAAKGFLRMVNLDPSNNNPALDTFEGRTVRCIVADRVLHLATDFVPGAFAAPVQLVHIVAGNIIFNAIPYYRTYQAVDESSVYEEFNPSALVNAWAFAGEGDSKPKVLLKKIPVPTFISRMIGNFVEDGLEKSTLPNLFVRSMNSYCALLQSSEIRPLIEAYVLAKDKAAPKQALQKALYKQIKQGTTMGQGVKSYLSTYSYSYVQAAQILETIQMLENSIVGVGLSDHQARGELIEILAQGFVTQILKAFHLSRQIDEALTPQEIKQFYQNGTRLMGWLYLPDTDEKTRDCIVDSLDSVTSLFLERGAFLTEFVYQRGRTLPLPQEFEEMLSK